MILIYFDIFSGVKIGIIEIMELLETTGFNDYELLDSGDGYRLERFGKFILSRPDPQIIWKKRLSTDIWNQADAIFQRTFQDKGNWIKKNKNLPDKWQLSYKDLKFWIKLTPFKHTGIFPEQHLMWDFISSQISDASSQIKNNQASGIQTAKSKTEEINSDNQKLITDNRINILNLFAYTGIASLAAASAGAKVTHVDASKPAISWARENQNISQLDKKPIRWILDDATKFVTREIKRGIKYDGIIMDPPIFGHGPDGILWKFNDNFPKLLALCKQILSDQPLFIIINAYAISSSSLMLKNVMEDYFSDLGGKFQVGELVLKESKNQRPLSTGIFGKWSV